MPTAHIASATTVSVVSNAKLAHVLPVALGRSAQDMVRANVFLEYSSASVPKDLKVQTVIRLSAQAAVSTVCASSIRT